MIYDLRIPPSGASESSKLGWLREAQQQADQANKSARAYASQSKAFDMVLGAPDEQIPDGQSRARVPRAKRDIRELVSTLANLRPTASNKTENAALWDSMEVFNKLDRAWWYNTHADRSFRTAFQRTAVEGTAYTGHVFDPDFYSVAPVSGFGGRRGDIRTDSWGANDVFLVFPPRDHDLQRCYAVGILTRTPIWLVQAKYPLKAHLVAPDHGNKAWTQKGLDYVQSFMTSPLRALTHGLGDATDNTPDSIWPTVDVLEWYVLDLSVNLTGHDLQMGEPGTSWEYTVPSLHSMIPTGTRGYEGLPRYKKAAIEDCLIYPLRRKIVQTSIVLLYDTTSEWWHGRVPLARSRFDDWPWEEKGFPLTRDVASIEEDVTELLRGYTDAALLGLDPPMAFDENVVGERLANRLNLRAPRTRIRVNLSMGDPAKPLLPADYRRLPEGTLPFIDKLYSFLDHTIGVSDLVAMAKAKQVPSADVMEKMMQLAGPLADDMLRGVECTMLELGEQRRYLNAQFMNLALRMQILGESGETELDFDYDPGTLIPSHMPDENPDAGPSRYSRFQRGRWYCGNFHYQVVPYSMAKRQQLASKLLQLQLVKLGFPWDPWSIGEDFEVDNVGAPPPDATTRIQRYVKWTEFMAEFAREFGAAPPGKQTKGRKGGSQSSGGVKNKSGGMRSTQTQ